MRKIELLAPARDADTGIGAVNFGADAVYIGAGKFGARAAASNSIKDIEKLIAHARIYHAKVYAAVNTLIYEHELEEARELVFNLWNSGIDGIIIQDMAFLEMDLPPVALHASTQANSFDPERVKFLDRTGISRIVLARELTLEQIGEIKKEVKAELEIFIHGALCVSLSGQCYMSAAIGGRSGNRGECAQPCRKEWDLVDSGGRTIAEKSHLLSLKDLSHAGRLESIIDAGADSLKIEGRLKDAVYVKNTVAFYRKELDRIISRREGLAHASSGHVKFDFEPDPHRTFNRGFTSYFINGRKEKTGTFDSPKSKGVSVGRAGEISGKSFTLKGKAELAAGDGLAFFDRSGKLRGMRVNRVDGSLVYPLSMEGLYTGALLYRNHDAGLVRELERTSTCRKIGVHIKVSETSEGLKLQMTDSDGICAEACMSLDKQEADQGEAVYDRMKKQLEKLGNTPFTALDTEIGLSAPLFIPVKTLNELRRSAADELLRKRAESYRQPSTDIDRSPFPYPFRDPDYTWNVTNSLAEKFYKRHGAVDLKPGFEISSSRGERLLMQTKMCLKYEMGLCPVFCGKDASWEEPVFLSDGKRRFRIEFDCSSCMMKIYG